MKKPVVITAIISCWLLMPASTSYAKDVKEPWQCALYAESQLLGYFAECSGIGSESEVIEFREGGEGAEIIRKIPGSVRFGNLVLKRGVTNDTFVWDWRQMVVDGDIAGARKNITIVMYDKDAVEVARWNFFRAWPAKVIVPESQGDGNDIAIEVLTIAHEGLER